MALGNADQGSLNPSPGSKQEPRVKPGPGAQRSALERTLHSSCYISEDFFAEEREKIFFREWVCVGREEQLPIPGDYLVLDVVGESILVVRSPEGELRAFYNVCRHRGSRLCATSSLNPEVGGGLLPPGKLPGAIRCPYHSWTYNLKGELISAPHISHTGILIKEEFPLYPVGLETWGGFFFLNLTPREASERGHDLRAQLGPIPERLGRYPLRDLRTARRITYDVAANWKVLVENYNECYHCGPVHPELCEVVPAFKRQGGAGLDWSEGIPHRAGAFTFTKTGVTNRRSFAGLSDEEKVRHKGELIYPNFMLSLSSDHVAAFTLWPRGSQQTQLICDFLFHPEEMARPDFDPSDASDFWDLINRQDWEVCERVQQGLRSKVHQFGYYAPMEN